MGLIIHYVNLKLPFTLYSLLFAVLLGAILYGVFLMVLIPKKVIAEIKSVKKVLRHSGLACPPKSAP
jgi:hypothetical protein